MTSASITGQPYELSGNRMAFTSWHYVHPARVKWHDTEGNDVSVHGRQGPAEALFRPWAVARGVRLVTHKAQRLPEPMIRSERPWEPGGPQITSILHDQGIYRAWAGTSWGTLDESMNRAGNFLTYYESDDGLTWRRPNCGLIEYDGSTGNNIVAVKSGAVFIDPAGPAEERYKWVAEANDFTKEDFAEYERKRPGMIEKTRRPTNLPYYGVRGAVSPDGLRWNVFNVPIVVGMYDTQNIAYYDVKLKRYVLYTREWIASPQSPRHPEPDAWVINGRRAIGRAESSDFRAFPSSQPIIEPPLSYTPNQTLYTNCRTSFPGDPDAHLMFPTVWDQATDVTHIVMAASHDGALWSFLPGEPVFHTSEFGRWDGGCIFASPNLVELPNGDFALPYTGYTVPHKYPRVQATRAIGCAVWPRGRVIGIEAADEGEFTTVSAVPPSQRLRINALTKRVGGIRIEVRDPRTRQPISGRDLDSCQPLTGDLHRAVVRWKGGDSLGVDPDTPVTFRISVQHGAIYWLDFD
jgi:hypothetical protein